MNMYPEIISEQNRERIQKEMDSIRLEEEAAQGQTLLDKNLALLGELLVSSGEKLRNRAHSAQEMGSAKLVNKAA